MVTGLSKFKEYFKDFTDSYVLIGGAACNILFAAADSDFRATRDLDMVLIVDALTADFASRFWDFINDGDYRHISGSSGKPQFYRFDKPQTEGFPKMIELFSRADIDLKKPAGIIPLHVDNNISSLSAILLDDSYYQVLQDGRTLTNGFTVLRPEYLILFKAKAYLDLSERRSRGERIDSSDIRKHKKDILRLAIEMVLDPVPDLPQSVLEDIHQFISLLDEDPFDTQTLGTYNTTMDVITDKLKHIFGI